MYLSTFVNRKNFGGSCHDPKNLPAVVYRGSYQLKNGIKGILNSGYIIWFGLWKWMGKCFTVFYGTSRHVDRRFYFRILYRPVWTKKCDFSLAWNSSICVSWLELYAECHWIYYFTNFMYSNKRGFVVCFFKIHFAIFSGIFHISIWHKIIFVTDFTIFFCFVKLFQL